MATNPREVTRQQGSNDGGSSDQFFLDPKMIYEQREKLTEKKAKGEDAVSSKPGAYSSVGGGERSQTGRSNHTPSKAASHGRSPSRPDAPNKNAWQSPRDRYVSSSSDDDDDFASYVTPQEIQDQREKLEAKVGQHPPGNVRQLRYIRAVPSSSSSKNTVKTDSTTTTTGSSSNSEGSRKGKHKKKDSRRKKKSRKHSNTGTSDHLEQPQDEAPVQASPVVPSDNGDPVIIATATRDSAYEPRNQSKRWIVCFVISALAIGVGIGIFFGTLGKSSPSDAQDPPANQSPTMSPVANTSAPSPTTALVIRPSEQDCKAIAAGQSVREQDQLTPKRFNMFIKVVHQDDLFAEDWNPMEWIQSSVLPTLANCELQKRSVRALRSQRMEYVFPGPDRDLQSAAQGLVGNAKVVELEFDDDCQSESVNECHIAELVVRLFVKDPDAQAIDLMTLLFKLFNDQKDLPAPIESLEVLEIKVLPPEEETSVPVPTVEPSQVAIPQPTTIPTVVQSTESPSKAMTGPTSTSPVSPPTESPTKAMTGPTSTPPVARPTESPMQGCDDSFEKYFHDTHWMEEREFSEVEGNFLTVECSEELPLIFLDVGAADNETCSDKPICIDALPYQFIEEGCVDSDNGGVDIIELELLGNWDGRHIVYGYENLNVENPCKGNPNLGAVVLEEEPSF